MNPVEEENQALAQQEEFEQRLFASENAVVLCAVPVTKGGHGSDPTKQYFLVLTINKSNISDCKIHTVRVRDDPDKPLSIQKTTKMKKLVSFEANDINSASGHHYGMASSNDDDLWSFKLHFKNGTSELWNLSPNSYRSTELFAFIIYHIYHETTHDYISLKPWEGDKELQVYGREWLDRLFSNSQLFRRINSIQHEIFTPIYTNLTQNFNKNQNDNKGNNGNEDNNGNANGNNGNGAQTRADVPFMTEQQMKRIQQYMDELKVDVSNIHLLESRLIEKQRSLVKDNIDSFYKNENDMQKITQNVHENMEKLTKLKSKLENSSRYVEQMDNAMRKIKVKNKELAIQDSNYSKLRKKLEYLRRELELNLVDSERLQTPNLTDDQDYKAAIKAAKILIKKLQLEFPDGLEGMQAVRSKKKEFQNLKRAFCDKVKDFCKKEFERLSNYKKNKDSEYRVNSHASIHRTLGKHNELMRCVENLDVNTLVDMQSVYEKSFSALYLVEFRDFFKSINANIYSNHKNCQMTAFKPFKMEDFVDKDEEKSEISKSNLSTNSGIVPPNSHYAAKMLKHMPTLEEKEDANGKMQVVRAYQIGLEQFVPLLLAELTFCTEFFELSEKNLNGIANITSIMKTVNSSMNNDTNGNNNNMTESEKVTLIFAEKMIKSMFNPLSSEFNELIDKADKMDKFNTLHMLIVTERTLHTYQLESDFLASFLTQLQQKLAMLWNKFISNQVDWITSHEKKVKQAGVLIPFQKFPPFCYQMYQIIINANRSVKSLLELDLPSKKRIAKRNSVLMGDNNNNNSNNINSMILADINENDEKVSKDIESAFMSEIEMKNNQHNVNGNKSRRSFDKLHKGGNNNNNSSPHYHIKIDEANDINGSNGSNRHSSVGILGQQVDVVESEHVSMTIHKMTSALFRWLDEQANADRKYRSACLMENFHYFYVIFSKMDGVRALDEHVHKAKKEYKIHFREYVRWCVKYECESLVQCWDKLNHQVQTSDDLEVVSVFVPIDSIKKVIKEFFDAEKKIDKRIDNMWKRLKKHFPHNDVLVEKVWHKVGDYFLAHYKRFNENIEKCYHSASKEFSKMVKEDHILQSFKNYMPKEWEKFDDNSSLASTSIGASSVVSGVTAITAISKGSKGSKRPSKYAASSRASNSSG